MMLMKKVSVNMLRPKRMAVVMPKRYFSAEPPGNKSSGSTGGPGSGPGDFSDDDDTTFESDRRFSNFILFTGAFALGVALMASNYMQQKK